ncbi:MAG: SDR family NAD(P)-dependent oxidoreductase [Acidimicrobiia bacterium]
MSRLEGKVAVADVGVGYLAPIAQHPLASWQKVIDLTPTDTFLTLKAVGATIADNGAVVAISSLNALQPAKGYAAYCAATVRVIALVNGGAHHLSYPDLSPVDRRPVEE